MLCFQQKQRFESLVGTAWFLQSFAALQVLAKTAKEFQYKSYKIYQFNSHPFTQPPTEAQISDVLRRKNNLSRHYLLCQQKYVNVRRKKTRMQIGLRVFIKLTMFVPTACGFDFFVPKSRCPILFVDPPFSANNEESQRGPAPSPPPPAQRGGRFHQALRHQVCVCSVLEGIDTVNRSETVFFVDFFPVTDHEYLYTHTRHR